MPQGSIVDNGLYMEEETMTKEEKSEIDRKMTKLHEFIQQGDKENAIMYLRGDAEFQNAVLHIKGDVTLLAQTFIHHMENNPQFKQWILAVVGSWKSKNSDEHKMFNEGIELSRNNISLN